MTQDRIQVRRDEGVGMHFPPRDPNHADPEWFQRDLDDPESDDPVPPDPLPTERHRTVPGFS